MQTKKAIEIQIQFTAVKHKINTVLINFLYLDIDQLNKLLNAPSVP